MAIEKLIRRTCDRCKKVIGESESAPTEADAGDAPVKPNHVFYLDVRGIQTDPALAKKGEVVSFEDLCSKCCERVLSLKGQITLEKADADDKSSETLDAGPKPKDNKGSKSAETKPV